MVSKCSFFHSDTLFNKTESNVQMSILSILLKPKSCSCLLVSALILLYNSMEISNSTMFVFFCPPQLMVS